MNVQSLLATITRSIWIAVKENVRFHYAYRSASISFYLVLSFFPVLIVISTLLSFFNNAFLSLVATILEFYPQLPLTENQVVSVISSVMTEQRGVWGIVSFATTYLLSTAVFAVFYRSLLILFEREDSSKRHWFIRLVSIPTLLMAFLFLRLSLSMILVFFNWVQTWSFLNSFMSLLIFKTSVVVISNLMSLSVVFVIFLAYFFLIKRPSRNLFSSLLMALVTSVILLVVSKIFTLFLSFLMTTNPVYAAFGSLLGLFSYIYILVIVTLIGARSLFHFEYLIKK